MNRNMTVFVNVFSSYGRLLFCAFLGLLSSRWILSSLGEVDFGLFSVVGGITGFLTFISATLAASVQRHFAYSIGQGKIAEVRLWFNNALCIHLILGMVIFLFGIPFGWWMIRRVLNIPGDRIEESLQVFFCVLGMTAVQIGTVPFLGMFIAKQKIFELSLFSIAASILNAGFAYCLFWVPEKRFLIYGIGLLMISVAVTTGQVLRAGLAFQECKIEFRNWFDRAKLNGLLSFAGWSLFGVLGNLGRIQGLIMLVNIYWGAKVNSALGIANQIGGQTEQISAGLFGAIAPEITASAGNGEHKRVVQLSLLASKFSIYLSILVLAPLLCRLDSLLELWLKDPPMYTAPLSRIILLMFLTEKLSSGYMVMVNAYGKIARYQAVLGSILLMTLPLAYIMARCGAGVVLTTSIMLLTTLACSLGRVWWVWHFFDLSPWLWIRGVLLPVLKVAAPLVLIGFGLNYWLPDNRWGLLVIWAVLPVTALGVILLFGLEDQERRLIKEKLQMVIRKACGA